MLLAATAVTAGAAENRPAGKVTAAVPVTALDGHGLHPRAIAAGSLPARRDGLYRVHHRGSLYLEIGSRCVTVLRQAVGGRVVTAMALLGGGDPQSVQLRVGGRGG